MSWSSPQPLLGSSRNASAEETSYVRNVKKKKKRKKKTWESTDFVLEGTCPEEHS